MNTEEQSMNDDDCFDILLDCLATSSRYNPDEVKLEIDYENTDEEHVYIYITDNEDEVIDYYCVERANGLIAMYDYDGEEWKQI